MKALKTLGIRRYNYNFTRISSISVQIFPWPVSVPYLDVRKQNCSTTTSPHPREREYPGNSKVEARGHSTVQCTP